MSSAGAATSLSEATLFSTYHILCEQDRERTLMSREPTLHLGMLLGIKSGKFVHIFTSYRAMCFTVFYSDISLLPTQYMVDIQPGQGIIRPISCCRT